MSGKKRKPGSSVIVDFIFFGRNTLSCRREEGLTPKAARRQALENSQVLAIQIGRLNNGRTHFKGREYFGRIPNETGVRQGPFISFQDRRGNPRILAPGEALRDMDTGRVVRRAGLGRFAL